MTVEQTFTLGISFQYECPGDVLTIPECGEVKVATSRGQVWGRSYELVERSLQHSGEISSYDTRYCPTNLLWSG